MSFPNLKYLILDSNMITSINNFPAINSLQTLSITNNNINDLSSFINAARTKYPQLRSVNTFRNPMNPGVGQPAAYNQYKSYMKQIGRLTELDGMNINDTSFMNQQQQQPKRDLFGTSTGQQPKKSIVKDMITSELQQQLLKLIFSIILLQLLLPSPLHNQLQTVMLILQPLQLVIFLKIAYILHQLLI